MFVFLLLLLTISFRFSQTFVIRPLNKTNSNQFTFRYELRGYFVNNETIRIDLKSFSLKSNEKFVSNLIDVLRYSILNIEENEMKTETKNVQYSFESSKIEEIHLNKTFFNVQSANNELTRKLFAMFIQYSIIFVILILLQISLSMRKRRIAELVHQQFILKAQRFRRSFSSISNVRHSIDPDEFQSDKEFNSSPITNQSDASMPSTTVEENEPFIKINSQKNHVAFLLGEGEDSDEIDDGELKKCSTDEPYGNQTDALLSMAHILDSDKPWAKYKRPSISVF